MQAGDVFNAENLKSIRPANGIHPRHYEEILGKRACMEISAGTPLHVDMIER